MWICLCTVPNLKTVEITTHLVLLLLQLLTSKNRGPFIQFLQLLVVHHPSKRLRSPLYPLNVSALLVYFSSPEQDTSQVCINHVA